MVRTILLPAGSDLCQEPHTYHCVRVQASTDFFEMQMLTVMFPVDLYNLFKQPPVERIFIMTYGPTSLYFSGVMVCLILVLAPVMCILGSIEVFCIPKSFMPNLDPGEPVTTWKISAKYPASNQGL
ncbi:hypothetical protein P879_11013 [Paragonimus westermani]|uniref:Dolichyl-diphosphooligosaccharide--protein glycosyltransferase subunit STT3A n=1 Tax=Paragonimus westermani TaxID=34504 RepID=A0A8T0DDN0_9TREM|nr:hypothetical protein P879_11013 [Paragonimus westermani]